MAFNLGAGLGALSPFLKGYTRAEEERRARQERDAQMRRQDELLRLQQAQDSRAAEDQTFQRQQQRIQGVNALRQLLDDPTIDDPTEFDTRFGFAQQMAPQMGVDPGFLQTLRPPPDTFTKRKLTKLLDDFERRPMSERQQAESSIYWEIGGERYTPAQARQALGRGGFDARTGQPFAFTPPPEPQEPPNTDYARFLDRFARERGKRFDQLSVAEEAEARKLFGQADDRPPAPPNQGVQDQRRFTMEQRLVAQWDKANTPIKEMRRQLGLMQTGLQRFRSGDTNGGAQAVLVTFQKILDPTSVVRESEYARTAAGQSLMHRIEGFAQRLASGGAGLTDSEMAGMVQTAQEFLSGMDAFNAGLRRRIEATAQEYALDPRLIFDDVAPPGTAGGPRPGGGQNPFRRGTP